MQHTQSLIGIFKVRIGNAILNIWNVIYFWLYACQWLAILWKIIYAELISVVHYLSALLHGIGILNINDDGGSKELFVDIYNTQTGKWGKSIKHRIHIFVFLTLLK